MFAPHFFFFKMFCFFFSHGVLFCFVLFCFVLFCFVLFCFVLFCFVLFCFVLFCFVLFCFVLFCFVLFCFVLFCFDIFSRSLVFVVLQVFFNKVLLLFSESFLYLFFFAKCFFRKGFRFFLQVFLAGGKGFYMFATVFCCKVSFLSQGCSIFCYSELFFQ